MSKKKVLGVIPARLDSIRVPEKMLKDIAGKKLIERTIERTLKSKLLDKLIVTTDSKKIADVVEHLGVSVIMTETKIPTGTDRVVAAVKQFNDFTPDIIVNIWGDEPLYSAEVIDRCIKRLNDDPDLQIVTAADRITDKEMLHRPSFVKVLTDIHDNALFFSRAVLPYPYVSSASIDHYHVMGILAMRLNFFKKLPTLTRTPIESCEGVEQMRILEYGYKMGVVKGNFKNLGVNTPEEMMEVKKIYEQKKHP